MSAPHRPDKKDSAPMSIELLNSIGRADLDDKARRNLLYEAFPTKSLCEQAIGELQIQRSQILAMKATTGENVDFNDADELKKKIEELNETIKELQKNVDSLMTTLGDKADAVVLLNGNVEKLETQRDTYKTHLENLGNPSTDIGQINQMIADLEKIIAYFGSKAKQIARLESDFAEKKARQKELHNAPDTISTEDDLGLDQLNEEMRRQLEIEKESAKLARAIRKRAGILFVTRKKGAGDLKPGETLRDRVKAFLSDEFKDTQEERKEALGMNPSEKEIKMTLIHADIADTPENRAKIAEHHKNKKYCELRRELNGKKVHGKAMAFFVENELAKLFGMSEEEREEASEKLNNVNGWGDFLHPPVKEQSLGRILRLINGNAESSENVEEMILFEKYKLLQELEASESSDDTGGAVQAHLVYGYIEIIAALKLLKAGKRPKKKREWSFDSMTPYLEAYEDQKMVKEAISDAIIDALPFISGNLPAIDSTTRMHLIGWITNNGVRLPKWIAFNKEDGLTVVEEDPSPATTQLNVLASEQYRNKIADMEAEKERAKAEAELNKRIAADAEKAVRACENLKEYLEIFDDGVGDFRNSKKAIDEMTSRYTAKNGYRDKYKKLRDELHDSLEIYLKQFKLGDGPWELEPANIDELSMLDAYELMTGDLERIEKVIEKIKAMYRKKEGGTFTRRSTLEKLDEAIRNLRAHKDSINRIHQMVLREEASFGRNNNTYGQLIGGMDRGKDKIIDAVGKINGVMEERRKLEDAEGSTLTKLEEKPLLKWGEVLETEDLLERNPTLKRSIDNGEKTVSVRQKFRVHFTGFMPRLVYLLEELTGGEISEKEAKEITFGEFLALIKAYEGNLKDEALS